MIGKCDHNLKTAIIVSDFITLTIPGLWLNGSLALKILI